VAAAVVAFMGADDADDAVDESLKNSSSGTMWEGTASELLRELEGGVGSKNGEG